MALLGAVAIGWAPPADGFAAGLAAWHRALRGPPFLRALVPTADAFRDLMGRGEPATGPTPTP